MIDAKRKMKRETQIEEVLSFWFGEHSIVSEVLQRRWWKKTEELVVDIVKKQNLVKLENAQVHHNSKFKVHI